MTLQEILTALVVIVGSPLGLALARWLPAVVTNLSANNRGQNAALEEIKAGQAQLQADVKQLLERWKLEPTPAPLPPAPRRKKAESIAMGRIELATPLRGVPILPQVAALYPSDKEPPP